MMIKPLGMNMLIKAHVQEKVGGIVLPNKRNEREWNLEVLAVGEEVLEVKTGEYIYCRPMDIVFLNNWVGEDPLTGFISEEKVLGIRGDK